MSRIQELARELLGCPYKDGGRDAKGLDCLGMVLYVLNTSNGTNLPDPCYSPDSELEQVLNTLDSLTYEVPIPKEGDIVFIPGNPEVGMSSHVGVSLGGEKYLSCNRRFGVVISRAPRQFHARYYRLKEQ